MRRTAAEATHSNSCRTLQSSQANGFLYTSSPSNSSDSSSTRSMAYSKPGYPPRKTRQILIVSKAKYPSSIFVSIVVFAVLFSP